VKADQLIGTVDWFDAKLGYGFIGTDQGDFYVHISAVERARRNGLLRDYLQEGQTVQFDLEPDKFGKRQKAINIRLAA
jgi:cold shock CspA family protein